jgi:hypothetical protein
VTFQLEVDFKRDQNVARRIRLEAFLGFFWDPNFVGFSPFAFRNYSTVLAVDLLARMVPRSGQTMPLVTLHDAEASSTPLLI